MKSSFLLLVLLPYGISCSVVFAVVGLASLYAGYWYTTCLFGKCCRDDWRLQDFQGLLEDFQRQLHGQHIAEEALLRYLKSHYLDRNPKKALVLSLHGTTGSGKNFVTTIIINRLLQTGEKNKYFKLFDSKHHFSHKNDFESSKKAIKEMVYNCPRSIFVFDEANDLPSGFLDILKPMMDEHSQVDGVDYRKATFFFLSNTGSTKINKVVFNSRKGLAPRDRSALSIKDFKDLIADGFDKTGGSLNSQLNEKKLVDSYIPFLPMERDQIKLCVRDYLLSRKCPIANSFIEKIADLINYEPPGYNYFASYGCRGIDSLVKQEMEHDCIYNQRIDL